MGEKRESHGQRNMFVFIGVERMNDEFQQANRIIVGGKRKNTSCALLPGLQRYIYPHQSIWEKTSTQRGANEVDWTRPTVPKERPLNTHRSRRSVAHGDDRTQANKRISTRQIFDRVDMMSSCRHAQVNRAPHPSVRRARPTRCDAMPHATCHHTKQPRHRHHPDVAVAMCLA